MPWPEKQQFDDKDSVVLKVDQVVKVRLIDSEPELYYTHYLANEQKSKKCAGEECPMCASGEKRHTKGTMLVVDIADGKQKNLKGSAAMFIALRECLEMCGGKDGFIFALKATGEKQQRRYHVVPLPVKGEAVANETDDAIPF